MYRRTPRPSPNRNLSSSSERHSFNQILTMSANYFWTTFSTLNGNYVAVVTVVFIVILSFILPDLSQKIHRVNELKTMKEVLLKMSSEVGRAEVACLTVADEIRCLHSSIEDGASEIESSDICASSEKLMQTTQSEPIQIEKKYSLLEKFFSPRKKVSHKEVTIMSYLYTDSFEGSPQQINSSAGLEEYTISDIM